MLNSNNILVKNFVDSSSLIHTRIKDEIFRCVVTLNFELVLFAQVKNLHFSKRKVTRKTP